MILPSEKILEASSLTAFIAFATGAWYPDKSVWVSVPPTLTTCGYTVPMLLLMPKFSDSASY